MDIPRGLLVSTLALLGVTWGLWALSPSAWPGLTGALAQTAAYGVNVVLTIRYRSVKIMLVRAVQRRALNPLFRSLLAVGVNPLGLALLETRGRSSGQPRRTPVGNGRMGKEFWLIAEHGIKAGYVRNLIADPRVRIRLRIGLRYRWVTGIAQVRPDVDPLACQRRICRWHPLRALNAANVRVLGADLVTVRVDLAEDQAMLQNPAVHADSHNPALEAAA